MDFTVTRELLLKRADEEDPALVLKSPEIKQLYQTIATLPNNERAEFGQKVNQLKQELQTKAQAYAARQARAAVIPLDVTAPFDTTKLEQKLAHPVTLPVANGTLHPLTEELNLIVDIFSRMGFDCNEARQIDDDYHMFTSLNFPPNHPARDGYDTFRTEEGYIPPAHTTAMENRTLRAGLAELEAGGKIAEIHYGRVFRNEDADVTHDHTFNQFEGVYVAKDASLGKMLGLLAKFFETYYGEKLKIKTQPGYFPFTEPSLEVAVEKPAALGGRGKGGEWLEMLGCGMLHPNVLREAGIDPAVYCGFAWGGGVERLVMLKYGIEDLRHFESGKLAFVRKFK